MPDIFKKVALFYESTKKLQKIMNTTSPSPGLLSRSVGQVVLKKKRLKACL